MKKLLILLVLLTACYLIGAFVEWAFYPGLWHRFSRFFTLAGFVLSALLYPYPQKRNE